MNIGDVISFDKYQWRIIEIKDSAMLLITEHIVNQRPYHNLPEGVTWANSEIRAYLNGEFLEQFNSKSLSRMLKKTNKNNDNPWYGSEGGEDTNDIIFLLSLDEAVRYYFGDSSKNLDNPSSKQRYWFQRKDENNSKRQARYFDDSWWWWLRTPGRDNKRAVYIHGDGNIGIQGNRNFNYGSTTIHRATNDNSGGIRPAVWVKIY